MPLAFANVGNSKVIKQIMGNEKTRHHLEHLGFVQGETVTVLSEIGGNLILNIKDSRIAVNKVMASKIMVY